MTSHPRDRAEIERRFGTTTRAARQLAEIDWRSHVLGPPEAWSPALVIALRNMLASPDAQYILWGEDRTFLFNDACPPTLGKRLEEAMGWPATQVWPDEQGELNGFYERAVAGEAVQIVDMPVSVAAPDFHRESWWSFTLSPIFDVDGSIAGVQCIASETTGRVLKAAEERRIAAALAASERRLHRAQEAGHIGIFSIDLATNQLVGTPEFHRMFGLPITESMPASVIEDMVIAEDQTVISHPETRRAQRIELNVEYRIRRPDTGEIRWIERRGEFERDEQGRPTRLVGVVQDVTERQAARAALAELNATLEQRVRERTAERNLLARVIEETDNLVFVLDTGYRVLAINRAGAAAFAGLFGRAPDIGEHIEDAMASNPANRLSIESTWGRAMAGEEFMIAAEFDDPGEPGGRRTYELKYSPLRVEDGEQSGAFLIGADVTERVQAEAAYRQMQDALRQSQKMEAMGQLTGGVAHDFNNLLTPIIGSLDLLQRYSGLPQREIKLVDGALQSAERAKTLVQRLLAFARRQPLQAGPVDMAMLVDGMAELVVSTSGPLIRVRTDIPEALPLALADHNQLEMAILNLCVNARDAMPDGGTIDIVAVAETIGTGNKELAPGLYLKLSVIDSGTGMEAETLRRAIEPFYSTKGIGKGTGLGLSMVDGLASQLGGTMRISSRLGLGTRVDLWLPVSTQEARQKQALPDEPARAGFRGRALVVDDEPLVRTTTVHMLGSLGYETSEAANARDAEAMLQSGERFDLVVTDHLMPGKSGAELARTIRQDWPDLPVLIVSGYADTEAIAPDMPRLAKPFREHDLARAIGALG